MEDKIVPEINVSTTKAKEVWRSPDGQRVIFELELEYQGKPVQAKTYSKEISEVGWEGTVETYEKQGRGGAETFVKQPQKEQFRGGGYAGGSKPSGKDEAAIQAMWAITKAIEWAANDKDVTLSDIPVLAIDFFTMVDAVKNKTEPANKEAVKIEEPLEGQISLEDISKVFEEKE